jgi:hypothetical protein
MLWVFFNIDNGAHIPQAHCRHFLIIYKFGIRSPTPFDGADVGYKVQPVSVVLRDGASKSGLLDGATYCVGITMETLTVLCP